ncbi:MAG: 3-dehydroquinate synthase [Thermoanaerobaculia bacterium]|nr:3-dehydroquinate synthase [Thermoanaerobaculia bacterium]
MGERLVGRRIVVVSAPPIVALHRQALAPLAAVSPLTWIEVPDGEAAKSLAEAGRLWERLLAAGGRRDLLVVALGGGAVSDLAGFAAGAFLRGVDWIGVPTTLLAQVDAAIGGKTGVDLPAAKNAVGLFHHPLAVWAEPALLATLSVDARRCGLVEAIKVGAVLDLGLFERLESAIEPLLAGDAAASAPVVAAAARAKAALVESDLDERGARQLLNFGHTLGHAIEAEVGYGAIAHGDAVAHGLRFALALSRRAGGDAQFADRVERLLDRLAVPPLPALAAEPLLGRLAFDKKARAGGLGWVLLRGPGRGEQGVRLPADEVAGELTRFLGRWARGSL